MTTDAQALLLRLLDPSNRSDPYPVYDEIRAHGALHLSDMNLVVFSSFADCDEVLRHPSSASDRSKSTVARRRPLASEDTEPPSFLFLDPPRSHPAAQVGQQGVRAEGRQRAGARHHRAGARTAR